MLKAIIVNVPGVNQCLVGIYKVFAIMAFVCVRAR